MKKGVSHKNMACVFSCLERKLVLSKDGQKTLDPCSSLYNLNFKINLLTPI